MAIGFTTTSTLLKDQAERSKSKELEVFGVAVLDDTEGKHDIISTSNAQLHLFMQMKRGNVDKIIFQSAEQAEIFFKNITTYYGEEKANRIISSVSYISVNDAADHLRTKGLEYKEAGSFEEALTF